MKYPPVAYGGRLAGRAGSPALRIVSTVVALACCAACAVIEPRASRSPSPCESCHGPAVSAQRRARTVHAPFAGGECESCHHPHPERGGSAALLAPDRELCLGCHDDPSLLRGIPHGAIARGGCRGCHAPHSAPEPHLLTAAPEALCARCHPQEPLRAAHGGHVLPATACGRCHAIHAGGREKLLGDVVHAVLGDCALCHEPPGAASPLARPRAEADLCGGCHDWPLPAPAAPEAARHHPAAAGARCTSCHDPHTAREPALLVARERPLCLRCHAGVAERLGAKAVHAPARDGCAACHAVHGAKGRPLLAEPAAALCGKCHPEPARWMGSALRPCAGPGRPLHRVPRPARRRTPPREGQRSAVVRRLPPRRRGGARPRPRRLLAVPRAPRVGPPGAPHRPGGGALRRVPRGDDRRQARRAAPRAVRVRCVPRVPRGPSRREAAARAAGLRLPPLPRRGPARGGEGRLSPLPVPRRRLRVLPRPARQRPPEAPAPGAGPPLPLLPHRAARADREGGAPPRARARRRLPRVPPAARVGREEAPRDRAARALRPLPPPRGRRAREGAPRGGRRGAAVHGLSRPARPALTPLDEPGERGAHGPRDDERELRPDDPPAEAPTRPRRPPCTPFTTVFEAVPKKMVVAATRCESRPPSVRELRHRERDRVHVGRAGHDARPRRCRRSRGRCVAAFEPSRMTANRSANSSAAVRSNGFEKAISCAPGRARPERSHRTRHATAPPAVASPIG